VADDDARVPAGWYPDPLGLPQLRWWDNHAWTEHTSDARQPGVTAENAAPPRVGYAEPEPPGPIEPSTLRGELPVTRRAMRERERLGDEDTTGFAPTTGGLPAAVPPRSLEAGVPGGELSPAARYAAGGLLDDAPTSPRYELAERHDDLLGAATLPRSAFAHVGEPTSYVPAGGTARTTAEIDTSSGPAWGLTLVPVYMLVAGMLLLLTGPDASFAPVTLGIVLGVPWLGGIALAIADGVRLRRAGMQRPASWAWALAGAPVYLVARLIATVRETGRGFGPVVTYLATGLVAIAATVAVPGLAMQLAPAVFAAEAESSVADDALALGTALTVDCPETPPMLVQQSFECTATNRGGTAYTVIVSLQRANGWIDWRVDDWGAFRPGRS
jgi:hypothetical protein